MINKTKTRNARRIVTGLGTRALQTAAVQHMGASKPLDPAFGWCLLRDKRVPVGTKMASLGMGILMMFVLQALEIPLQSLIALALPVVGFAFDVALDGMEAVLAPVLFASLILPHIAPKEVTAQIRQETPGQMRRVN